MLIFLLFNLAFSTNYSEIEVIIGTTVNTPDSVVSSLSVLNQFQDFDFRIVAAETISVTDVQNAHLIIDLTYSVLYCQKLSEIADSLQVPFISQYKASSSSLDNRFYFHPSAQAAATSIEQFLNYLNWNNFMLFISEGVFYQQTSALVYNAFKDRINNFFFLSEETEQDEMDNLVGKMVKVTSSRQYVLITSANISSEIVTALIHKKIFASGTGVLVYGEALAGISNVGVLGITEKGLEKMNTSSDYVVQPIVRLVTFLQKNLSPEPNIASEVKAYFAELLNHLKIVNVQSKNKVVGSIFPQSVTVNSQIIFPGGLNYLNSNLKTAIQFGYAGGSSNPSPIAPTVYNTQQMTGVPFSVMMANNDSSILPNFNFSAIYTDCGVYTSNSTYIDNCLNNFLYLGVGFLSTSWSASTVPYINYFNPIPVISGDATYTWSNVTLYPTFTRVVASSTYWALVLAAFVHANNWKRVVVLTTDTPKTVTTYNLFVQMASLYNIEILNDINHRFVTANYNRSYFNLNKETFQNCVDTGGRIYVMIVASPDEFFVVEAFYDLGLRRGDMQIVSSIITGANIFASELPEYRIKREELFEGALGTFTVEWIGTYGATMKNKYIQLFNQSATYRCVPFDQAMLLMRAVAAVLNNGYDYEDPVVLNKYIRQIRFTGCSGSVSIAQGSNDRSNQAAILMNLFDKNGTWVEQGVAIFDPSSQTPFEIIQEIIWCDGTYNVPNDYRFSLNCPFDETKAYNSTPGFEVLYIICFVIALVTIIISFLMFKAFGRDNYEELKTKKIITAQDMLIFAVIAVEIFQYLSLGITPSDSSTIIDALSEVSGVNFQNIITVSKTAYWNMIMGTIVALWIWLSICFMIILRSKEYSIFTHDSLGFIDLISEYLMPILGDLGFLPIVSVIMNIYVCTLTVTGGLTQSYNPHDCTTYCWTGKHLTFAIVSLISLTVYIPLALYFRPIWQNYQSTINIMASSRYMIIKSTFQVFNIVLSKTVAYSNRYVFGYLYTGLLFGYALLLTRYKPYNYGIANLWTVVSIFFAGYGELLYSISISTSINGGPILGILIAGWALIFSVGYFIQSRKLVSYLYTEPSRDIPEIIKDAFRMNKFKYKIGDEKELEKSKD